MEAAARVKHDRWERLPPPIQRLADIGCTDEDTEETRLRRRVLNLAVALIALVAPLWVVTYALLGLWVSAAIPLVYMLLTAGLLRAHSRRPMYRALRSFELTMMLVLPFALQWTLGGFAESSVVSLWGLSAPLGAVFFVGTRGALPWFVGFVALVVLSAAIDPALAEPDPPIPEAVNVTFFALDLVAVSATVFLLTQYFVRATEAEQARSERLLLNVLPRSVAHRLKRSEEVIADAYPEATVLFADIADFTPLAERMRPEDLVMLLDRVFTRWDGLASRHGVEKIKTIGDAYMVVSGVPEPRPDHAAAAAWMALEMLEALADCGEDEIGPLRARVGIDTGPVVAGVIGRSKFIYDLWGDTVNTASRMESTGEPGRIQVTAGVRELLVGEFAFRPRGVIEVKGKGPMSNYFLERPASTG